MRFATKYLNFVIIFLILTALVLGYAIYSRNLPPGEKSDSRTDKTVSEEEIDVLKTPSADAPIEEKQRHFELTAQFAKEAEYLDIGECAPTPLVLKIKVSNPLKIKNPDENDHTIVFSAEKVYTVKAQETKTLNNIFDKGLGVYGYGCDTSPTAVGLFFVTAAD